MSVRQLIGMFIAAENACYMFGVQAYHSPQGSRGISEEEHRYTNLLKG